MGMKTASVWLANKWCVYTKALGEDVERFTEFDLQKVTTEEKEELVVIEKNAPANEHYTRIILSQLSTNAPKPGKWKDTQTLIKYLQTVPQTGNVEIIVNGQSLEAPDYGILYAPFYKTPDGENILWRKEIDFEMGEYKAKGFIAILDKIQNGANGLVLMRRGRVIVGGGDERYFPTVIFGQSGSFRYRRLFGEIELEGFEVSFNKNGFREEEDLYLFMDALKDELKADNLNILGQTDNYRQRGKDQYTKISKAIKKDLEKKAKPKQLSRQVSEVEAKISNQQYLQKNEDVIINAKPLDSYSESFQYNGKNYILTMDLVTETETDSLYSAITTDTEENLFLDTKSISCKINLAHPFLRDLSILKKDRTMHRQLLFLRH